MMPSDALRPLPRHSSTRLGVRRPYVAGLVLTLTIGVLGACGSSDDESPPASAAASEAESDVGSETDVTAEETDDTSSDAGAPEVPPVADVAACLEDAGYAMVTNEEQLSEQQRADLETAFGQVDGLTFDAATNGFAGGIQFFDNEDQVEQRADTFADVALELRPIGTALISVEAGSNFDDAVAAAEMCLT